MKKLNNYISKLLLLTLLTLAFIPATYVYSSTYTNKAFIVEDSVSSNPLPYRFREIKSLKVSGSSQFTPSNLPNINKQINSPKLFIVDLRQESHGFINNIPISFYNPEFNLNKGFNTSQTIASEKKSLASIPLNSTITTYDKATKPLSKIVVNSVLEESTLVRDNNLSYVRLSINEQLTLTPKVVDQFVAMVKHQVNNSHIHFHCDSGEDRTTTFLSMYQIMKNKNKLSLKEILSYQYSIGGVDLTKNKQALDFLNSFYRYSQENFKNNFRVSYSNWIKSPTSKYNESLQ